MKEEWLKDDRNNLPSEQTGVCANAHLSTFQPSHFGRWCARADKVATVSHFCLLCEWLSKPEAHFFSPPKILRAGRSSSSQEGCDFWKEPNSIWIQVWWIRWSLKPRNTIFGQIQGYDAQTLGRLFAVAQKLALKWIPRLLQEQLYWRKRTAQTGHYILTPCE